MKEYIITLIGCDDETTFKMDLTDEQFETVKLLGQKSKEISTYSCMPILTIDEA